MVGIRIFCKQRWLALWAISAGLFMSGCGTEGEIVRVYQIESTPESVRYLGEGQLQRTALDAGSNYTPYSTGQSTIESQPELAYDLIVADVPVEHGFFIQPLPTEPIPSPPFLSDDFYTVNDVDEAVPGQLLTSNKESISVSFVEQQDASRVTSLPTGRQIAAVARRLDLDAMAGITVRISGTASYFIVPNR